MSTRTIAGFFRVASLLLLLLAVALLSAIATMQFAIHGAEVQVPALKGMTVADALSETAGLGLNLDVDNRYYSGDVAARAIIFPSLATVRCLTTCPCTGCIRPLPIWKTASSWSVPRCTA